MNSAWQAYLRDRHAAFDHDTVVHFGNPAEERRATRHETIITDLSSFGLIRFSGDDARDFLQNQLTCDLREVDMQTARYGSYCTPKGRILANFTLWQHADSLLMQLPLLLVASIQKRLSMYVLRAKVQLTNISDDWIQIGLAGTAAVAVLEKIGGAKNTAYRPFQIVEQQEIRVLCLSPQRFVLITATHNAPMLWERLNPYTRPVGADCWEWLTIHAGIPIILPQTQEQFTPQMANLDALGGVSFKKGCYPGQEIVARTHYLGKLKRRMFLTHIATEETVNPGDLLYSKDMADQPSGMIVNAVHTPDGGTDALAVIQLSSVEAHNIHWRSLHGPALVLMPLPYPLEPAV
ncbi:MAG: folate-binding protein [Nitrosomonas sp.]|nr:MAG: folate-binding protein [Nitrosomonas sp.]